MIRVLVVDDDQGLRFSVKSCLQSSGRFWTDEAQDGLQCVEKSKKINYGVVLLDVDMPLLNGLETLKLIKEINPGTVVIMMTAFAAINHAVQAVKDGAYHYLQKPVEAEHLIALIDKALAANQLISNVAGSSPIMIDNGRKIIGNNQQMVHVFNMIHKLSKVDTPVLIRGPSGTGKELVARAIHFNSSRKEGKFVAINCSAIPESLFESELFGHEKGSFTGAEQRKIGKFQYAEGGTIFLDEVGDTPLLMQAKLLRVLQEKVCTPVGSLREVPINVRVIAATNKSLEEMMRAGKFREDFFYRLNVIPIHLPSLADRKDDLDSMIMAFIRRFNEAQNKRITSVSPEALAVLKKYDWPGNIRELENVIEHMFVMENSSRLTLASLPSTLLKATGTELFQEPLTSPYHEAPSDESSANGLTATWDETNRSTPLFNDHLDVLSDSDDDEKLMDFSAQKEAFEKEFIIKALKIFGGRINQTALHANIPKKTLLRKIEKYGIVPKNFSG